jgi:hypothetical protein
MTANEILMKFKEGLATEDQTEEQDIDLNKVIFDILTYLADKENIEDEDSHDRLWTMIMGKSQPSENSPDCNVINLVQLRQILEEFKILGDEKDGM